MKTKRPLLIVFLNSGIIFSLAAFPGKYFSGFWLDINQSSAGWANTGTVISLNVTTCY